MRRSHETQFASGSYDDLFLYKSIKHVLISSLVLWHTSRPKNNMGLAAMVSYEKATAGSKAYKVNTPSYAPSNVSSSSLRWVK
jgi:hypothetical protein